MLGSIVFLMCLVASVAAFAILFILYGPVPVRRKVTIIPRIAAPDPFVDQPAAQMIQLPQVAPAPAVAAPYAMPSAYVPPMAAHAPMPAHAPLAPASTPAAPRAASPSPRAGSPVDMALPSTRPGTRARAATPDVAPLVLRRPGNPNPPPLSRMRAARGTEPRPRPSPQQIEAMHETDLDDPTTQVALVEHDEFIEDGR